MVTGTTTKTAKKQLKKSTKSQDSASNPSRSDTLSDAKQKPTKKKEPIQQKRETLYPSIRTEMGCPLTADTAKKLLGWQEETENVKFKSDFQLRLPASGGKEGTKVCCTNNIANRHLSMSVVALLKQEILRGNWQLNGEPIIVGSTGLILNGQHTLIALILAAMEWHDSQGKWNDKWKTEPTIDKLVVLGIEESDDVVNTLDTGRPRTLTDVIYRSEYFANVHPRDRIRLARMLDHAIRFTWSRTGAGSDAFAPRRTHAESLDFLRRHQRLLEAVKHVYEENGNTNTVGKYLSPGYASGLLYLMASSKTSEDGEYSVAAQPSEDIIDFSLWEKACEFFVALAAGDAKLDAVRQSLSALIQEDGGSIAERVAVLIKAWGLFVSSKRITTDNLALEYTRNEDGIPILTDSPSVGGIDLGDPVK